MGGPELIAGLTLLLLRGNRGSASVRTPMLSAAAFPGGLALTASAAISRLRRGTGRLAPLEGGPLKDIARIKRAEPMVLLPVVSVPADTDQEFVAELVSRYDLIAIPVVDEHNRLLGSVQIDDVLDVLREEATEDILKMAGAGDELADARSYGGALRAHAHARCWLDAHAHLVAAKRARRAALCERPIPPLVMRRSFGIRWRGHSDAHDCRLARYRRRVGQRGGMSASW